MDVRRHDSAAQPAAMIEQVARRISRALGYGDAWAMPVDVVGALDRGDDAFEPTITLDDPDVLAVADPDDIERVHEYDGGIPIDALPTVKRGRRMRPARRDQQADTFFAEHGERKMRRPLHYFNKVGGCKGIMRRPSCRMDGDPLAALGTLPRIRQAMLLTYAGELQHWPEVAHWCLARGHRIEAACAAGDRILWTRPDRTLAEHAFRIGMRQADFRALVHLARADLDSLLVVASRQFVAALGGTRKHPPVDSVGRDRQHNRRALSIPLFRAA